jgi:hypothetical protein
MHGVFAPMLDPVQNLMCGELDVKRDISLVLNQGSYCTELDSSNSLIVRRTVM